mgnify:CR=1 FL=1
MNMLAFAINAAEKAPLSDGLTLTGIDFLCNRTKRRLEKVPESKEAAFARDMADFPVATHTDDANRQHYEVPAEFFSLVLGPQRKYSCSFREWPYPHFCVIVSKSPLSLSRGTAIAGRINFGGGGVS